MQKSVGGYNEDSVWSFLLKPFTLSFCYERYKFRRPENDFESIIAQVLSDAEPVVLDVGSGDRVVVMPLDDFSAWQETAYLLKSPANAAHLSKSISEAQAGKVTPHALDE